MTKSRLTYSTFLILTSMWWGWTVLTDIFVVPVIFRHIDSFFRAGEFAIAIFSRVNILEVITASILVALTAWQTTKNKKALPLFILSVISGAISFTYFAYLTPKILELTKLWESLDSIGLVGTAEIPDVQQEHHFFHNLYIRLDVVKLLLLTIMLSFGVLRKEKWV